MNLIERVAHRFRTAKLEVGRTFFSGALKIHRFAPNIRVTDMTNAGRRGKKVREMSVSPGYVPSTLEEEILDALAEALVRTDTYEEALDAVHKVQDAYPGKVDITESVLRGVDVEPVGAKITVKTNTDLEVTASPQDFQVIHHAPLAHPKTGVAIGFQDTSYWPRKKQDGAAFYAWLKANLAKVDRMTIQDLRDLWHDLGINYDFH